MIVIAKILCKPHQEFWVVGSLAGESKILERMKTFRSYQYFSQLFIEKKTVIRSKHFRSYKLTDSSLTSTNINDSDKVPSCNFNNISLSIGDSKSKSKEDSCNIRYDYCSNWLPQKIFKCTISIQKLSHFFLYKAHTTINFANFIKNPSKYLPLLPVHLPLL